jgi:hypothetical protein
LLLSQNTSSRQSIRNGNDRSSQGRNAGAARRVNSFGYLVFDGQTQGFACTIATMSSQGADIQVSGLMGIPESFDLYAEQEQARYRCEVTAQRGGAVRVTFSDREENRRFRDLAARR